MTPARQRVRSRRAALPEGADATTITDSSAMPLASNGEGPKYRAFLEAAMQKVNAAMELTECTIPQHLQHNNAVAGKQAVAMTITAHSASKFRQIRCVWRC